MRKTINRKGFSLVELMIVVVIMGILIAVAIPLYGAIQKNAEKRTCQDNQRSIRAAHARYILDHANDNKIFKDGHSSFNGSFENAEDVFKEDFLGYFDGSVLPYCPVNNTYYTVTVNSDVDIEIVCSESEHNS